MISISCSTMDWVGSGTGRFEPEYAEVCGVPFAFIPGDRQIPKPRDPPARNARGCSPGSSPSHGDSSPDA
jgi:hypothetical protein